MINNMCVEEMKNNKKMGDNIYNIRLHDMYFYYDYRKMYMCIIF